MFDIGWTELLVIGAIALIVVGPKELPGMLRTFGQMASKARGMAREFQRSMEDAAREVDVSDLRDAQKSMADWNRKIGAGAPKTYAEAALKRATGLDELDKPAGAPSAPPLSGAASAGAAAPLPAVETALAPVAVAPGQAEPSPGPKADPAPEASSSGRA